MDTPAPYTTPPPARATAQSNAVLYPAGPWTEAQQSRLEHTVLEGFAMKKRALAAEARVQELLAELAGQEVEKLRLIKGVKDICGRLYWATQAWEAVALAADVRKKLRALLAGQSSPIELLNPVAPAGEGPQPWCARCPATEADVNAPGFHCAECKAAGI